MSDSISISNAVETVPLSETTTESQQSQSTTSSQQTSNSSLVISQSSSNESQITASSDGVEDSEETEEPDYLALDSALIAVTMLMKSLSLVQVEAEQKTGSVAEAENNFAAGDEDENNQVEFNPYSGNFNLSSIVDASERDDWPLNPTDQTQAIVESQPILI